MHDSSRQRLVSKSPRLAPHRRALERIDAHLERTNLEDEEEKINRALVLMFGPDPLGFTSDPKFEAELIRTEHETAKPSGEASAPQELKVTKAK